MNLPGNRDVWDDDGSSHSVDSSLYEGKVEQLHESYKSNGLIKVRIPVLHQDTPLSRIPWARMSDFLRALCIEWDLPKAVTYTGQLGVFNGSGSSLSASGNCPHGGVSISGDFSMSGVSGTVEQTVTPAPYSIQPYAQLRTGEGLIRVGDSVLVHVLNGNGTQLAVTEIYKMGG